MLGARYKFIAYETCSLDSTLRQVITVCCFIRITLASWFSLEACLRSKTGRSSGMQRSGDARGDCLIGCPPTEFWYWAVAYGGHCCWIYVVCDVTIWRHIPVCKHRFGEICWHKMHILGRPSSGRAGVAVKMLRTMETYNKQINRYQLCLFLFINNVDFKTNNINYRKSFCIF